MTITALNDKERAQWRLHRLLPGRPICNVGSVLQVGVRLRRQTLQSAVDQVVARHPLLRSVVTECKGVPWRRIGAPDETRVVVTEVSAAAADEHRIVRAAFAEPFDLERGPLVRVRLIALPGRSVVCLTFHHLVADGVSAQVVLRELAAVYDALLGDGVPQELRKVVQPYVEEPPDARTLRYWSEHLAGVDPLAQQVTVANALPDNPTFSGARIRRQLNPPASAAVRDLRALTRSTDNVVLLAAYFLLLARHGAGPDLVVGVPTTGRPPDKAEVVGYHADLMPVRVRVDLDAGFRALVSQVRRSFLGGLGAGKFSFESVHDSFGHRSGSWRTPLIRHSFNYNLARIGAGTIAGAAMEAFDGHHGLSRLDLNLSLIDDTENPHVLVAEYSAEAFDDWTVSRLLRRYEWLLMSSNEDPDRPVSDVDMFIDEDRRALASGVGPSRAVPPRGTLGMILDRARSRESDLAVDDCGYGELLARAWSVRTELARRGIGVGDVVGVCAARGPDLAAAVLGVWLAGAAYVPLDPAHPPARSASVLEDAGVCVVLADGPVPWSLPGCELVRLDVLGVSAVEGTVVEPDGTALAYVMYTSGSTGRPKGVEISHGSLGNLVSAFAADLELGPDDTVLWLNTFAFDLSTLELLAPLAVGARLVAVGDSQRLNPGEFSGVLQAAGATVAMATPTMWRVVEPTLPESLAGCRLLCGGETLDTTLADRLLSRGCRVFNAYGPTETTVVATMTELRAPVTHPIPIGAPIANVATRILDDLARPVPPGVPGELWIGGAGVGIGYRGDEERTRQRFVTFPRIGRHYRTGDRVRQLPDGRLEFLGRVDRQVKVRGHRIELGEVEAALRDHPAVEAAAAWTTRAASGGDRLAAAVRTTGPCDSPALRVELMEHVAARLPGAGVPGSIVVVTEFPRTASGKVDYRALSAGREQEAGAEGGRVSADSTVGVLVSLWREVLGDATVSEMTNFFLAGGHSILAVELAERLSVTMERDVGFELVFHAPTPVLMATALGAGAGGLSGIA